MGPADRAPPAASGAERPFDRAEWTWLAAAVFILATVAFVFPAMRFDAPAAGVAAAVAGAGLLAGVAWRGLPRASSDPTTTTGLERLLVAAAVVYFAILCHGGDVLPAGDSIAVPLLAGTVAEGRLPLEAFPPGSSAHAYPPGYPILFAPARALLAPVDALGVFKALNILTAALIPAAWAWLQIRLFRPPLPAWAVLAASYFAFLAVERTMGFALSIGGKNAILLGLLLTPPSIVLAINSARTWAGMATALAVIFGLTLVHYSLLHLTAALLAAYAAVGLASGQIGFGRALRLGLAVAGTAALMWLLLKDAASDPRAGAAGIDPAAMLAGAGQALSSLAARAPPMVIYMDADFGMADFPYRGLFLIACTGFSLFAARRLGAPGLRAGAVTWFVALLVGLAFGYQAIPARITLDFARWFLWAVQAAIIAHAACAALAMLLSRPARAARLGYAAAGAAAAAALAVMLMDAAVETFRGRAWAISRRDLLEIEALVDRAQGGGGCGLIGEPKAMADALVVLHAARAWNYAEIMTTCRFLNGSWVQPGVAGGRALDDRPSPDVLRRLGPTETVIYAGQAATQATYAARLRAAGLEGVWTPLGAAAGARAWRFEPGLRRSRARRVGRRAR